MQTYGLTENLNNELKDVDVSTPDGKAKEEKIIEKVGNKAVQIRKELAEEIQANESEIYKITYPNLSRPEEIKQTLGKMDRDSAYALINSGASLRQDYILSVLDDAIKTKQYDFITTIGKKFTSRSDDEIKNKKELDLKYAVDEKMREAFSGTDLEERYKYKKVLNNELKIVDAHIEEITYGKKKNYSDFKKALSGGQYK